VINQVTETMLRVLIDTAAELHGEESLPRPMEYSYGQAYLIVCTLELDSDIAEKVIAPMLRDGKSTADAITEAVIHAAEEDEQNNTLADEWTKYGEPLPGTPED
jgi:hypothetical protein